MSNKYNFSKISDIIKVAHSCDYDKRRIMNISQTIFLGEFEMRIHLLRVYYY